MLSEDFKIFLPKQHASKIDEKMIKELYIKYFSLIYNG